ncbi:hypothetical protein EVAR_59085_1 [Eumeta japonica]|uniref:Uncharacterized protein n=1 Tax=Eumeta variegata TaxID=151549 RepID=A0A4C1YX93_EUMVA|nr:hypothetical protein EVAR_59085_1 [Eumeta japonica]
MLSSTPKWHRGTCIFQTGYRRPPHKPPPALLRSRRRRGKTTSGSFIDLGLRPLLRDPQVAPGANEREGHGTFSNRARLYRRTRCCQDPWRHTWPRRLSPELPSLPPAATEPEACDASPGRATRSRYHSPCCLHIPAAGVRSRRSSGEFVILSITELVLCCRLESAWPRYHSFHRDGGTLPSAPQTSENVKKSRTAVGYDRMLLLSFVALGYPSLATAYVRC